jgi:3-hydroxybutyryl-CoA dehydratase
MVFDKKKMIGRKLDEINVGEKLSFIQKIEDKDLLLYLGLTNDSNPIYIQHDYASQTPYERPVVPSVMLTGIISSAVSKYLPGPGSHILNHEIEYTKPVYHYETIEFLLEVIDINQKNVAIKVVGKNEKGELVIHGQMSVRPPYQLAEIEVKAVENF